MRFTGTWLAITLSNLSKKLRRNTWNPIQKQPGYSTNIVVIKTTSGYYIECLKRKNGERVTFEQAKDFSGPCLDIDKAVGWKTID